MILDKIENTKLYFGISDRIKIALQYISKTNFSELENGVHSIIEGEIFAIVNRYGTIDAKLEKPEVHRKYIDVQYVYEGNELIGYATKKDQPIFKKYNTNEDFELLDAEIDLIKFNKGMFAILFPDDLHAPGIHVYKPENITKIVVKVLI